MRADYIEAEDLRHILAALMPANRLALELSLATGLRISDCLELRTAQLKARPTVRERKTGKRRRVYIPAALLRRLQQQAGAVYVFEGRGGPDRHRHRTTVYRDLQRAAKLFRAPLGLPSGTHISPHTARKVYAVEVYRRTGDMARVQDLLQHTDPAVTMLYALADVLTERRLSGRFGRRRR